MEARDDAVVAGAAAAPGRALSTILETARLRLREVTWDDLDEVAAMVGDAEQMAFYAAPRTREEASVWLRRTLAQYDQHGIGFWVIETIEGPRFLGYGGIRPITVDGADDLEIGWHVDKAFWNRGIATEAATAARDLALERFPGRRVLALIHPDNVPSRRVAEKIGMVAERETVFEGEPTLIYVCAPTHPG